MKKKIYLLNFEKVFLTNELEDLYFDRSNIRNFEQLQSLLRKINAGGHRIILFSKATKQSDVLHKQTIDLYLDEILTKHRTYLTTEDIHIIKDKGLPDLLKSAVLKFNSENTKEPILANDNKRVVLVDDEKNTSLMKFLNTSFIPVSKQNDEYLERLKADVNHVEENLSEQWDNYSAHQESFWQRHKGKITLIGIGAGAGIGAVIGGPLGAVGAIKAGPAAGAFLGALFGTLPPLLGLGGAYTYSTVYKKDPTITFDGISSRFYDVVEKVERGASSLRDTLHVGSEGRALLGDHHQSPTPSAQKYMSGASGAKRDKEEEEDDYNTNPFVLK